MKQVYVQHESKRALNNEILFGRRFEALEYSIAGNEVYNLEDLPDGTVVKLFTKYVGGNPYAKAYGTIKRNRNGMVQVK